MKNVLFGLVVLILLATAVPAQKLAKPKKMPSSVTDAQMSVIQEGMSLHDAKKHNEAIAKYTSVLAQNPDATLAMYELALSYYDMGDRAKTQELARIGAMYISDELPLFYGLIANCLDDEGKPAEAIKIYRDAEDILKSFPDMKRHLASIYYNLGVTYVREKKYAEARVELKHAVDNNFSYASPHYLLAVVFNGTRYKVPAFLAASRLVSLEFNSQRTRAATAIIVDTFKPSAKDPKSGNITINLDLSAPKDEGDFSVSELLLGTLTTFKGDDDKNKSENEIFVDAIGTTIAMLAEDKKLASSFVGQNYVPFMTELKAKGHLPAFGNMVLYISDNNNKAAGKWLDENGPRLTEFLNWAKTFRHSGK